MGHQSTQGTCAPVEILIIPIPSFDFSFFLSLFMTMNTRHNKIRNQTQLKSLWPEIHFNQQNIYLSTFQLCMSMFYLTIAYNYYYKGSNYLNFSWLTSPTQTGSNIGKLYTAKWFGFWPLVANSLLSWLIFMLCIPQLTSGISLEGLPSNNGWEIFKPDIMSNTNS